MSVDYSEIYTETTFGETFLLALTRRPDNIAMVYGDESITYQALQELINRSVRAMQSLG